MTTYLGKSCSFCLPRVPFVNCRHFMYLVIEGRIWDLIVSVPDHCLSFYFTISFSLPQIREMRSLFTASNLLLVALSSAARDLPFVFEANCSLIISRSLSYTANRFSNSYSFRCICFYFIACCFNFSLQVCNSFFRLMLYYIYFLFEIIILNIELV